VQGLFAGRPFAGFGPNRLAPSSDAPPVYQVAGRRASALRAAVRQECPRRPGVYGMVDADGLLIYVGKAKCLRARLLSYFRAKSRDPKAGRIIARARAVVWECAPSEFAALLRELELIRRWRPRFNVQGQPLRHRRTFVCLGRQPAPYAYLAARPAAGVLACFGPVPAGRRAREAVRRVNDWFGLRDCPQAQEMVFADQAELFPIARAAGCIRLEIGTCLGPCAAACSQSAYLGRVAAAQTFLAGVDPTPLEALLRDMAAAAALQEYERALALRDRYGPLAWLHEQLGRIRQAREQNSFVYPVRGFAGDDFWYLIHGGRVLRAVPRPRDEASRQTAAAALAAVYGKEYPPLGLLSEEVDGVLLVAAWFRRDPRERERGLKPDDARALCEA
jgi:excinuclease ABC subunit C